MEKSGRILLRLPKSLHLALVVRAKIKGVSLNQLCVATLSTPLWKLLGVRKPRETK